MSQTFQALRMAQGITFDELDGYIGVSIPKDELLLLDQLNVGTSKVIASCLEALAALAETAPIAREQVTVTEVTKTLVAQFDLISQDTVVYQGHDKELVLRITQNLIEQDRPFVLALHRVLTE